MNPNLIIFATKTEKAHIAIVESSHLRSTLHFTTAQHQLHGMIESVNRAEKRITLVNGTILRFCDASRFELLRGLRLDRIETVPAALRMMPEWFLETRLKPGIHPDEGISFSGDEVP